MCLYTGIYTCYFQRFGTALVPTGQLRLKSTDYERDFRPIDDKCLCSTCAKYTRAYLHSIVTHESVACPLVTVHNVAYQVCTYHYILLVFKTDHLEFINCYLVFV